MALRELLSSAQREAFEAVPLDRAALIEHYVLSHQDLSLIRRRRGAQNRLGLAVQLALLRYPGRALLPDETPPPELLTFLARQLGISPSAWTSYAELDETRREHVAELQLHYGLRSFGIGQYPCQNSLHTALRELRRIERSLFMLEWMKDPELRRRVQVGLKKGEARNALARAVFFNRQGDLRDRSFENQRYRASGLNLIVAAVVLWNTIYLERAVAALRGHGIVIDDESLAHLSPIGWEHINLTGDYTWQAAGRLRKGALALRPFAASNE